MRRPNVLLTGAGRSGTGRDRAGRDGAGRGGFRAGSGPALSAGGQCCGPGSGGGGPGPVRGPGGLGREALAESVPAAPCENLGLLRAIGAFK